MSKVYARVDGRGFITRMDGGYTTPEDLTGWVLMDEGEGDRYNLCQSHYLPGPLTTDSGAYRYKLAEGQIVECTAAEIAGQEAAMPEQKPSAEERISELEAQNQMHTECLMEMSQIVYA